MAYTLAQIIEYLGEEVVGHDFQAQDSKLLDKKIFAIAAIEQATAQDISFVVNNHYQSRLATTHAQAVLITQTMLADCPAHTYPIIVKSPYLAYAKLSQLFAYQSSHPASTYPQSNTAYPDVFIHSTAVIGRNVSIGQNSVIGAFCQLGDDCVIGDNVTLQNHVTIQDAVTIGNDCEINAHVFIGHHSVIGNAVNLHSHASIANDGFGFAPKGRPDTDGWQKIHQLGRVVIGDNVRIGSHTCIDRGAINDTIIENNVIIDNLVQIAHNVQIGAGTAIAACVGIAGSTVIGKRCMIGGAAGFAGHIHICDDVTITGMAMVTKSINQAGVYSSGLPVMPNSLWKRAFVNFKNLAKTK